ncbi:hypothetical protein RA11412_0496 [Rothia aeria]|uniref:Peptidase S54 rhomboid domain-containing protein n=2 Tax=Micrococcaceae TaxID=1268 RepID=A0A2Z5QWJ0_9MICC|nr:hypothetical protein RA11412_0496 [Rothia aeria]
MICPDCYRDVTGHSRPQRARTSNNPNITYTLIGINVVVYLLQWIIPNYWVYNEFAYKADWVAYSHEYYRAITSGFLHSQNDPSHLLLNMVSLYLFGAAIEK